MLRALLPCLLLAACATTPAPDPERLRAEVRATEAAFARTMVERDLAAFRGFLAPDTLFWAGDTPLRGADAVVAAWARYFDGEQPPFSWEPGTVELVRGGTLAHSSGPVLNAAGERIARFDSVWERQPDGRWRVILDRGCNRCPDCRAAPGN